MRTHPDQIVHLGLPCNCGCPSAQHHMQFLPSPDRKYMLVSLANTAPMTRWERICNGFRYLMGRSSAITSHTIVLDHDAAQDLKAIMTRFTEERPTIDAILH